LEGTFKYLEFNIAIPATDLNMQALIQDNSKA